MRLDNYLVENGLISSRSKAQMAIKNGSIYVDGKCIKKNSFNILDNIVEIKGELLKYVSRAGYKLEKAITYFNLDLTNKVMMDIGSSTGGFSDCALKNNIGKIYAIDVGTNQMVDEIKNNEKVFLFENTDFRNINENDYIDTNLITIDVSFISVTKLLDKINKLKNVNEIICLIKPQFECGKDIADKYKGIILNKDIHFEIINKIIKEFNKIGFYNNGLTYSPIKGGSGNIEYLVYLTKINNNYKCDINKVINEVFGGVKWNL